MNLKNPLPPLNSFFMGGFECADHINRSGERINLQRETHHHIRVADDYEALKRLGISVVREGVCWSAVEVKPYIFDFSALLPFFKAARKYKIQIIWDLCHFGYPEDLVPTHPLFVSRFVSFCEQFLQFHLRHSNQRPWLIPINEISFLSWHSGDMRGTVPFAVNSGWDIKYHLCKAKIEAIKAIKTIEPCAVIMAVEPLVKIHAADDTIDSQKLEELNSLQFQAMDIILGRKCPELGGDENLVDALGFNYYYNNQWNHLNVTLPWPDVEKKHTPLSHLLFEAYFKYNKPIILTETGHFGKDRDLWLEEISAECKKALEMEIDLRGICIYPVIDRPDWDNLNSYSNCGIWDLDVHKNRIPFLPYLKSLQNCTPLFTNNDKKLKSKEISAIDA
ncbi:hypothetical protein QRD02_07080 [Aequorivita sp. SDUM287046]|uniref:Beta-glucosidase n=1 Tax=Aequorivita aurantiaca TaxID=3053356 RepID=A0ABT8DFL6_9FLAO|nr:hypothetical protein [Aequorivita aurantiaca]MDN3724140.1 hypothetical protein [Aequorivita aurantiaca]